MKKSEIVVVGSSNTDYVLQVAAFPLPGQTISCEHFFTTQGGKGANQAVAAARLGAQVTFVARVGNDQLGQQACKALASEGINTNYVNMDNQSATGLAMITVNARGENTIVVYPGANARLTREDVLQAEPAFRSARVVLLQLEIPLDAVQTAIELAHRHGAIVILNPAPARLLPASLIRAADFLTPNETELRVLAGLEPGTDLDQAIASLSGQSEGRQVIVTLGAQGVLIAGMPSRLIPAQRVKVVDTTAAGDAFNAALAVSLGAGKGLLEAVHYANTAGALATTRPGAQPSLPTTDELEKYLNNPRL